MLLSWLCFAAAAFSLLLASASVLRKKPSLATWCFFAGMVVFGIDSLLAGLSLRAIELYDADGLSFLLISKSLAPAAWLAFSLTYSRPDYRQSLAQWKIALAIVAALPIVLSLGFQQQLLDLRLQGDTPQLAFTWLGRIFNVAVLVAYTWVVMNLEHMFRSAIGTARWRVKFVVLGLGVIFAGRIYVRSQALLFSTYDLHWAGIESIALIIGCAFLVIAYVRTGFAEVELYPSRAVLRSSLTVLVVGGYLFTVGILARIVARFGGADNLELQAFVLLLGIAGLAALLVSDRFRQGVHLFISRHFARAQHDSVRIWSEFARRLAHVKSETDLCASSTRLVSETFDVLSSTIWLLDQDNGKFIVGGSTTAQRSEAATEQSLAPAANAVAAGLRTMSSPFDLEAVKEPWAEELRQRNASAFPNGGHRWCVPLRAAEQSLGVLVLADRVNGRQYTFEELQLLQCIADQITSVLLNLRLANEVARARELEALRTMSAFFVHDLKNTASTLNLMLKNMTAHFNDPAFREDALRGIANMAGRIDETIGKLTALRQRPDFKPVATDLNALVNETLEQLNGMPQVAVTKELQPVPDMLADREQIRSVVTNLVLNARDALGAGGLIRVRTEHLGANIVLSISDNGCGMTEAFLRDSLFRPFQSTKKRGLGIGMYQSRMAIEAHGGNIRVESEVGKGTTFQVSLPVRT